MVLCTDEDQRTATQAARDLQIPIAPPGIWHDEVFLRYEKLHQSANQRLLLGSGFAPIAEMECARSPAYAGALLGRDRPDMLLCPQLL